MRYLLAYLLPACIVLTIPVFGQETSTAEELNPGDPIIAMLDSLVSLDLSTRYAPPGVPADSLSDLKPFEVPTFPDEVYRERMAKIQSPVPLVFNQSVKNYIELYAYKRRALTARVLGLSQQYFPLFESVFDRKNVPLELKYLAVVESALNPVAVSNAGATGIWQFMYNTGKMYKLKITSYVDDRRDPYLATQAAAAYFSSMYSIYKDWLLVIAAYNCGPMNVNKAIRRSGGKTTFWEIRPWLPKETQGYVPAFIAVTYIMNYYAQHNIFPETHFSSYYDLDTINVNRPISFSRIATALDVSLPMLRYLNPVYKKDFVPASSDMPCALTLPTTKVPQFISVCSQLFAADSSLLALQRLAASEDAFESEYYEIRKSYRVRKGDHLAAVAKKLGCSVSDLKKWNNLKSNSIKNGQRLALRIMVRRPKPAVSPVQVEKTLEQPLPSGMAVDSLQASATETSGDSLPSASAPKDTAPKYIYHVIQAGDTLWNIAKRYQGVTVEQLKEINGIHDLKGLKPGSRIKIALGG